jgi:hypothetical protein
VGNDLTVTLEVPVPMSAPGGSRPSGRPVDRVVWRAGAPALVEARADSPSPTKLRGPVVDVAWSQAPVDADLLIATLRAERAAVHGGFDHPHTATGCVFCRRAAAAYR